MLLIVQKHAERA